MPSEPVEIEVDFGYGGVRGDEGVIFLSPKKGTRTGLRPDIVEAFAARGEQPRVGSPVRMIDPRSTADDTGHPLDMVVDGVLRAVGEDERCYATYDADAVAWVPSAVKGQGSP